MYAVTGASGKLGRLTIDTLIARGVPADQVVGIARTPAAISDLAERGVQVRAGDYNVPDSWPAALAGVDTLLLVSGSELGERVRQHTAVIDAAKTAGVRRIAYTSILNADTSTSSLAPEHLATEQVLATSGVKYTVLRNSWYFENYLDQADQYTGQGVLISAAGSAPFTAATRADYATAAAATLIDWHDDVIHELGGDKITVADVAEAITQATGATVEYRAVSPEELHATLQAAGVPEVYVNLLVNTDEVITLGGLDTDSHDLARLVGRPLTSLDEAAAAFLRR